MKSPCGINKPGKGCRHFIHWGCCLLLLALSGATAPVGSAAPAGGQTLALGGSVSGTLGGGDRAQHFTLATRQGEYLTGAIEASDAALSLAQVDAAGEPVRLLVDRGSGRRTFHFLAVEEQTHLRVSAATPTAFSLALGSPVVAQAPSRAPSQAPPEYLSPTIAALAGGGDVAAFWRQVQASGAPLVEATEQGAVMTFLARGAQHNARLLGGPGADHTWLERLVGTDVWYASFAVPPGTRLSYQIAKDIPAVQGTPREQRMAILATAQRDPFNQSPWPPGAADRFQQWSTVALPGAPPLVVEQGEDPQPGGRFTRFQIESHTLGNRREITLYQPPGVAAQGGNLLVVFDARAYQEKVPTPAMLDRLIQRGEIAPVTAVFVANPDPQSRARELPGNPAFADFMAGELLPAVSRKLGATFTAERVALAGSSYGGLAATTIAMRHPAVFGKVLSMSGSFWWHPPEAPADTPNFVASQAAVQPQLPLAFFLSAGLFERAHPVFGEGILDTSRHLRDVLLARKVPVTFRQYAAGHDYFAWQVALADGLRVLFPPAD
ncbi:alpha/beta hydrolase-fold protein [Parahaliea mediterranea]|uniref:alpha/beta hydrolase-fold protein n=1 Tax=Parahaliea mediterranea TaxID=651086 RepID=UPI0014737335|nr:alpha/beta hydrolase-fold protein [Parahaliea mediterranea]